MPRYHYSRMAPNTSEVFLAENPSNGHSRKLSPPPSTTVMTTTTSNNATNLPGSFTSTFIPFVSSNRTGTPTMREFIQIPVNREDGGITVQTNNLIRSVPITYITETNPLSTLENTTSMKPTFTNLLRPSSRYFQHHFNNNNNNTNSDESTANVSRVPSATRRLSLSVPVVTSSTNNTENDTTHTRAPASPVRQVPVRFPQTSVIGSTPTTNSRISSAILRSSPFSHSIQRRRTDLGDISLIAVNNSSSQPSSDFNTTSTSNTLPIRRAEAMAREAIQNMTQQQQQRNSMLPDSVNRTSPPPSRRVIINLKNNQSLPLDNHQPAVMKLPPLPYSPRSTQRTNVYHIPVLHELQMPPHPSAIITEPSIQSATVQNGSYKNELRMEIPVTIMTSNDQENEIQTGFLREEGSTNNSERSRSKHNPNQTLKSILKRSSSRETVSRKNVSFMNA
ncbi:unnamed protein product [Adineta ricciae]|uniref:Uncharacterized protein n=1 Tax=Adineta ricciae TaxID=249248 RepID=A0A814GXH0_ADIRI|nr:unnamed protein product [Adineta ricciae]